MRNLIFGHRQKQTWFDYGLDLFFIIFLFAAGDRGWAIFVLILTLVDIAVLAFLPDIEDKWWYKAITALVVVLLTLYVAITVINYLGTGGAATSSNLPL